jgi:hypothetical protein
MADSDDDVPISQLIKAKEQSNAVAESKTADEVDDEKPIAALIAEKTKTSVAAPKPTSTSSEKPGGNASDSEEDLPIAELMKRRNRLAPGGTAVAPLSKKPKVESDKDKDRDRNKDSKPKSTSSSANNSGKSSGRVMPDDSTWGAFYNTSKGLLVQRLLCRWWYAMEWPKLDEIGQAPAGYEALDGYPGVFVSTRVRRKLSMLFVVLS